MIVVACDPMRRIRMKNFSDDAAHITWTIKEDSIKISPLFISNSQKVRFDLGVQPPYNYINLSVGVGQWTRLFLNNFVDDLESLELGWKYGNLKLTDADSIKNFLSYRRMGLGKRKIIIQFGTPGSVSAP